MRTNKTIFVCLTTPTQSRARSTDCDKLTANQRFRLSDLVADFVTVILSQSESRKGAQHLFYKIHYVKGKFFAEYNMCNFALLLVSFSVDLERGFLQLNFYRVGCVYCTIWLTIQSPRCATNHFRSIAGFNFEYFSCRISIVFQRESKLVVQSERLVIQS